MIPTIRIMVKDCSLSLDKNVSANPETGVVFSDILFSLSINTYKNKKPLFLEGLIDYFNKL